MDAIEKELNKTIKKLKKNLKAGKITQSQYEDKKTNKVIKLYGRY